tara:strand:+ start:362 stop:1045 length:684 start_codon:yes stop_codon:yes gene_type:complete
MTSPIIVALDSNPKEALNLAQKLDPKDCNLKVGSQLFTLAGPEIIKNLNELGFNIFLDLKFHDIPNTVRKSVEASMELGVWMLNVHASGGTDMLKAASEALKGAQNKPILLGVTILTSIDQQVLNKIGFRHNLEDQVFLLAEQCQKMGLDGIVCSPNELPALRKRFNEEFLLVCPGIRSNEEDKDDQKRTSTPSSAIKMGADFLVIGREITRDKNPTDRVRNILQKV